MSPIEKNKPKLLSRIRRIKGQMEGVEKMVEEGRDCYTVLQTISACRGALNGLVLEMLESHIDHHVIQEPELEKVRKSGDEIITILKTFLK